MPAPDVLFGKAEEDLRAAHLLGADGSFGETVGFHCQQAIEKALKAVLEGAGVAAPKTHDPVGPIEVLSAHDIDVPTEVRRGRWLTGWAVQARYEPAADGRRLEVAAALDAADAAVPGPASSLRTQAPRARRWPASALARAPRPGPPRSS